ncbi:MAG TPA: 1,2-phenylacetyl-CoA epoxidase subunit PaaC [bacterium]|nr:1,2-phenylacetyl-CoA epoxidase subunit PaaC [bacterium]
MPTALAAISDPAVRAAFREWLLRVADDELTIGHRHSEWTGVGPDIESDVAMSSIAQEELGHARLFYEQIAGDEPGGPDRLAFGRAPEEYHNAVLLEQPNGGWEFTIVRLALYEAFEQQRLGLLARSGQEPVAGLAATLGREERYHALFAAAWLERLARPPAPPAGTTGRGAPGLPDAVSATAHARVQAALEAAWPHALAFFESTEADDALLRAGLLGDPPARQRETWERTVRAILEPLGLTIPTGTAAPGGRRGVHTADLMRMHAEMTEVWRSDPEARW